MKRFAVLTGDIVASTDLGPDQLTETMEALRAAAREIAGWADGMETGFAQRGGDGWQMALDRPVLAFRATLYLQAVLRRLAEGRTTRIAVAEGAGSLPDDRDPNKAHGPAFTASGRGLDQMGTHVLLLHAEGGATGAAYRLADALAAGWTQAQARALCQMLPPGTVTQAEAAAELGITRAAVQQALAAADYRALHDALQMMETGA